MLPLIAINHGYKKCFRNGNASDCTAVTLPASPIPHGNVPANAKTPENRTPGTAEIIVAQPNFSNYRWVNTAALIEAQNPPLPPEPEFVPPAVPAKTIADICHELSESPPDSMEMTCKERDGLFRVQLDENFTKELLRELQEILKKGHCNTWSPKFENFVYAKI